MTVTSTDIANRALQLVGTRTTIASLAEVSNEAVQINLIYNVVVDWCHTITNWNFARKTAALALTKTVIVSGNWASTSPAPPWKYEYLLPADFLRAIFVTNTDKDSTGAYFLGEPQRFAIATDTITAVQQEVLLTNQAVANLNYTSRVTDPTLWPAYFERFVVVSLAKIVNYVLTGDKERTIFLEQLSVEYFTAAEAINRTEGLIVGDTTAEWIQALGIPYPYRRTTDASPLRHSASDKPNG